MTTYDDFKKFIKNGIKSGDIKQHAVRERLFDDFLKIATPYNNEVDFFKNIVNIDNLLTLLKDIHQNNAQGLVEFLGIDNGFGNTWLKYFILWYVCNRSLTYPQGLSMPPLQKKDMNIWITELKKFIKGLQDKVPNDYSESEQKISDGESVEQNKKNNEWRDWPRQIILWGAPGTGKSYTIDKKIRSIKLNQDNIIRVTFHPAMDYSTFVGAYKPVMNGALIAYEFRPQAFLNAYEIACSHPEEPVFLIIEEINRGNCAQIFGDTFQLLDRDDKLESKYPITPNEDIKKWLESTQIKDKVKLKLPSNMFIWATMNSSDQSLYKLDSAFQRRWKMLYSPINPGVNDIIIRIDKNTTVKWGVFLDNINKKIAKECEDKKIGPFFVKGNNGEISAEDFVGKVLNYLYRAVFNIYNIDPNPRNSLSYDSFYKVDVSIFDNDIINTEKLKEFFKLIGCEFNTSDELSKTSKNDDKSDSEYEEINNKEDETKSGADNVE